MQADQAIFTSLDRRGKAGYHIVARSPGVSDGEAAALGRWCPSHDSLIFDEANPISVNFHALPGGRFALSRTCRGRPEYSGRGGWQTYTHVLVLEVETLRKSRFRPFRIYRDALALGYFHYKTEPTASLAKVSLLTYYPKRGAETKLAAARALGLPFFDSVVTQLTAGQSVVLPFEGDRITLAESLLDQVEPEAIPDISFATSLRPSSVRPYLLHVVGALPAETSRRDRGATSGINPRVRATPDL
ncbi:MAG: hypothetical protein U0794_14570 [Isosphaeraceae bacterium]